MHPSRASRRALAWRSDQRTPSVNCALWAGPSRRHSSKPRSRGSTADTPLSRGRRTFATSAYHSRRGSDRPASRASPASESRPRPRTPWRSASCPLSRRGHTVLLAGVAKASLRQGTNDHALLVEDVQVRPLHRFDMVVAGLRGPVLGALLRQQRSRHLPHPMQSSKNLPYAVPQPHARLCQAPAAAQTSPPVSPPSIIMWASSLPGSTGNNEEPIFIILINNVGPAGLTVSPPFS